MRRVIAPTSALTDARGHNEKAHPCGLAAQGWAVVSHSHKATGEGVGALPPVFTPTHPGKRTTSKLAISLSPRLPGPSRHGADNERPTV
jgi:hypothetical protein